MFTLVTGTPGSCKTSSTILRFKDEKKRPVFYRGIRDLTLPWTELSDEDAKNWREVCPEGSIVIIDEAQELFPVRASSKPVPPGLVALERHRHYGYDVVLISQEPSLLDSHARKIANEHYHYVRAFGAPMITEYHKGSGAIQVSNTTDLGRCSSKKKPLPKAAFGLYKSAETHTHKFRAPREFWILGILVLIAAASWYWFFTDFSLGGVDPDAVVQAEQSGTPGYYSQPSRSSGPTDWAQLLQEQVAGAPFTAPLYRERSLEPRSVPVVHGCMAFENDGSDCTCYTQQGTRIRSMTTNMCLRALNDGTFNHMVADADLGYPEAGRRNGDSEGRATQSGDQPSHTM